MSTKACFNSIFVEAQRFNPVQKTLRETALETNKTNPSQLGDPISLKAETSNNLPTNQDPGTSNQSNTQTSVNAIVPVPTEGDIDKKGKGKGDGEGHQTLRQKAMQKLEENPSQLGDPVSLKAEKVGSSPTDQDLGAKDGKSKL